MIKQLKNQRGMTLVELLAVIVIIGIIAAIAIPAIGSVIEKSKTKAHKANALLIMDAARLYLTDNPTKGVTDLTLDNLKNGYLENPPKDPTDNKDYTISFGGTKEALTLTLKNNDGSTTYFNGKTRDEILDSN